MGLPALGFFLENPAGPTVRGTPALVPARQPWPGSAYATRHRWQLDCASSLPHALALLPELAAELTAAHAAGRRLSSSDDGFLHVDHDGVR